jgi:hypothetical protein
VSSEKPHSVTFEINVFIILPMNFTITFYEYGYFHLVEGAIIVLIV